tara:strand:- start:331 stop:522 length:192 start_codon:yes stop_codon:yes gene_type:complete
MNPMHVALTRIPLEANSCASDLVKFNPAALMTLVGNELALGALPPPIQASADMVSTLLIFQKI